MGLLLQDFSYALRLLRQRLGVTSVAVIVMGLGISLTASMYAIIQGVVLSSPDYDDVDEVLYLQTTIPKSEFFQPVRVHDYLDWREQQTVFTEMAAYYEEAVNLSGDESRAERYGGVRMSASTFALLGRQPLLGRPFTPEQDLLPDQDAVIIGYDLWENRYGRDPGIIGRSIRLNAEPATVVGVMPEGFTFPEDSDLWRPLAVDMAELERRQGPGLEVIGRLAPGNGIAEVRTQLAAIAARLEEQYPEANEDIVPVVRTWREAEFVDEQTTNILNTMFVVVMGVLLIACANVANLLFALTIARSKELALRTAMGAARFRVLRQLLSETLVLSAGGAVLGLVLTKFSLDLFTRVVAPLNPPYWMVFEVSGRVVLFVVAITFLAALASGILPALQATRGDVQAILQDQSRGTSGRGVGKGSAALVALEVALSCALLIGAGLSVRSILEVTSADFGLERDGLLTARLLFPSNTYPDSLALGGAVERLRTELASLPGVDRTAVGSNLPVLGSSLFYYGIEDREYADDSEYRFGGYVRVSPDFFDILSVPIIMGRGLSETDVLGGNRVMVVDERFVELNWPGQNPIGKQVRLGRSGSENPVHTIVGVVRTVAMRQPLDFGLDVPENMFVPIAQAPVPGLSVMVHATGDPLAVAGPLRDMIARLDSDIPVTQVATLDQRIEESSFDLVIIGGMFTIFGVVALLLAAIGLYAVMAFAVGRRTSEVGIRMALGADGGRIVRLILRQGLWPLVFGTVVGLGLAVLLGRALATLLYNVSALDPLTFVVIPALLAAVSLLALLIPASRAARIMPVIALREE